MTDREILEAAKEEVGKEHHYSIPLDKIALLALQKQREQIKTELREKIDLEAKRRYAGERFSNGRIL